MSLSSVAKDSQPWRPFPPACGSERERVQLGVRQFAGRAGGVIARIECLGNLPLMPCLLSSGLVSNIGRLGLEKPRLAKRRNWCFPW